jgi:hypothetical protein
MHFLADVDRSIPRMQRAARSQQTLSVNDTVRKHVKNLKDPCRMATIDDGESPV